MKTYFKSFAIAVSIMFCACSFYSLLSFSKETYVNYIIEQNIKKQQINYRNLQINNYKDATVRYDELKEDLITDVDSYIKRVAPTSKVKAEVIVELSLKYNYDITLLLAQAHLEGHFATKGRASKTNSLFCVGSYDDGRDLCIYNDPNESIEPYIKLMQSKYIESDIPVEEAINNLISKNFRSVDGYLYAQNTRYGSQISSIIDDIANNYKIKNNQEDIQEVNTIIEVIASVLK